MNMDFGLFQKQSMKLVMTNELRQAITILQYSVLDLREYLHEQQLENPLIELKDHEAHEDIQRQQLDSSSLTSYGSTHRNQDDDDDEYSPLDHISDQQEGLQDYLLNQVRYLHLEEQMKRIVTYLALSVDENGYLTQTYEEMAREMDEPIELVDEAIQVLQSFEPHGIGASSLKECLLIQLRQMETRDELAEVIVDRYLDELAKKQYKKIAQELEVQTEDIQLVADYIQTLNPKPGALFHTEPAKYVVPDITLKKVQGQYIVVLNEQQLPKLLMNKKYESLLNEQGSEIEQYVKQKYEQFQWIIKSIQQRQETLKKVTEAIARHQYEFLEYGPSHLKPLTLKEIAEEVDVHESTVSRATTNKYVQTPKGLYELKYFFTSSVGKGTEESASSEKVKIFLKKMVDAENKKKPLSDQKLANELKEDHGIHVSRRTVAKYREEMHIPSSSQRKRFD
ncbi:RNA polymerase factor sigma-54 [Bacillus shivajii]|uniref:RNA polymerase factor sigma-54 n=1 Tax=Bacillus shivajii TaxID=1983719 RepID=UPI001CF9B618|nr:RNA polymerase factor sigma-54 [Bacillus shivajii]UCZ52628.1 RNA polymerase factor sigma-54 [Bacillus shivajii]